MGRKPRPKKIAIGDDATLDVVAQTLGITRERVRQIEREALAKLRKRLRARGYSVDDFFDVSKLFK